MKSLDQSGSFAFILKKNPFFFFAMILKKILFLYSFGKNPLFAFILKNVSLQIDTKRGKIQEQYYYYKVNMSGYNRALCLSMCI